MTHQSRFFQKLFHKTIEKIIQDFTFQVENILNILPKKKHWARLGR